LSWVSTFDERFETLWQKNIVEKSEKQDVLRFSKNLNIWHL
jgi:hypothetical protein